jgi:hypothetical protein
MLVFKIVFFKCAVGTNKIQNCCFGSVYPLVPVYSYFILNSVVYPCFVLFKLDAIFYSSQSSLSQPIVLLKTYLRAYLNIYTNIKNIFYKSPKGLFIFYILFILTCVYISMAQLLLCPEIIHYFAQVL